MLTLKTLIIKIGMGMRSYAYNHIFVSGPNMILICSLEVALQDVLVTIKVGDGSKLRLDRCVGIKSQLSNRRPYPSRMVA